MDLAAFLTTGLWGYAAVLARLGAALMFMPGFGETSVSVRHRVFFALALSFALWPATPVGVLAPSSPGEILLLIAAEVTIGAWIGVTARIIQSSLQFAGYQVGQVSGLANAFAPNIGAFEGATSVATFLLAAATALIFITDLHHVIIRALLMSYEVFPLGQLMPGDMSAEIARAASKSFYIGLSIAAPFYLMGILLNAGMGLANRMMATLPVFFIGQPLLIAAAFLGLAVAAPLMVLGFLDPFADWLSRLGF